MFLRISGMDTPLCALEVLTYPLSFFCFSGYEFPPFRIFNKQPRCVFIIKHSPINAQHNATNVDATAKVTLSWGASCQKTNRDSALIMLLVWSPVFRPFFTTKPRGSGTGLGLSTARRITEIQGGGLDLVDTRPGQTTFRVRLLRGTP